MKYASRKVRLSAILLLGLISLIPAAQATPADPLQDGDFEQIPSPWSLTISAAEIEASASSYHGNHRLKMNAGSGQDDPQPEATQSIDYGYYDWNILTFYTTGSQGAVELQYLTVGNVLHTETFTYSSHQSWTKITIYRSDLQYGYNGFLKLIRITFFVPKPASGTLTGYIDLVILKYITGGDPRYILP